jgi:hypothetical protein
MAQDQKQSGPVDNARISIAREHDLRYWSEKFRVSPEDLQRAVEAAGPLLRKVREHLHQRRS